MALTAISDGSLTGFEDATPTMRIKIVRTAPIQKFEVFDYTGSGDTSKVSTTSKRIQHPISGFGWYQTTADSGSTYANVHITANMASLSGALFGPVHRAIITKSWPLTNVTAATDAVPQVVWDNGGIPLVHGSLEASLETDDTFYETDHNASPATLVAPLGNGTLSGAVTVAEVRPEVNFAHGGVLPAVYSWQYSGAVTVTTNPFSLSSFTAAFDYSNGDSGSGTVKLRSLTAHCNFREGGLVPFFFDGEFSGAIS